MKNDKKNVDSKISLILLKRIGKTTKPGRIKMTPKQIKLSLKKFT
jgi:3-dehydroquinate synthetase